MTARFQTSVFRRLPWAPPVWLTLMLAACAESNPEVLDLAEYGGIRAVYHIGYDALQEPEAERERADDQMEDVVRRRLAEAGVPANVSFEKERDRLVVEAVGKPSRLEPLLKAYLTRPGYLEFRLVHEDNSRLIGELLENETEIPGFKLVTVERRKYYQRDPDFKGDRGSEAYKHKVRSTGQISPMYDLMVQKETVETIGDLYVPYYVSIEPLLDGTAIQSSQPDRDEYGRVQVAMEMSREGAKRFHNITRDYVAEGRRNSGKWGRALAIVVDDTLYSAPTLNAVISSGNAVISGSFSMEEAEEISRVLTTGALPVPLELLEMDRVEPTNE